MVAVTNLLSKYTILYGMIITLVDTIQSVLGDGQQYVSTVCTLCISYALHYAP